MNPYDKAHELSRAMRGTEMFAQMKAAKDKLESDEAAKAMLIDFQRQQLFLERKRLLGDTISEDEQNELQKRSDTIQMHEVVREYLTAEMQLGILYQDIQQIISEVIQEVSLLPDWQAEE